MAKTLKISNKQQIEKLVDLIEEKTDLGREISHFGSSRQQVNDTWTRFAVQLFIIIRATFTEFSKSSKNKILATNFLICQNETYFFLAALFQRQRKTVVLSFKFLKIMTNNRLNCINHLGNISVEDLQYIEMDLCFTDLVSLGFLLYAEEERANAEYFLQKLLVISQTSSHNGGCDMLLKYASINVQNWREYLIEALAIIGQRNVLKKLGFDWQELRQHYLPLITEISVHIHPLLKALYKMCEQLTPAQAGRMIMDINEKHKKSDEILRFYNYDHLEVFLLDWLTCRIINIGDRSGNNADLNVLLGYFKLHELDEPKRLLVDTLNSSREISVNCRPMCDIKRVDSAEDLPNKIAAIVKIEDDQERYKVRCEHAGIVLIINQRTFYEDPNPELKHLLPRYKLRNREGTDMDMKSLSTVFESFGYKPVEHTNLSHLDMLHNIREAVKRSVLFDSLIVCILSHGIDGAVYGNNSIPLSINDIEYIITADSLQGKPKLLIIQACQKDETKTKNQLVRKLFKMPLKRVVDKTFSNRKINTLNNESRSSSFVNNITADAYADVVKAMSTVPGHVSMRNTETGTWFIQTLCKALSEYGNSKHILDILTTVTREVSEKRGNQNEVMLPITVNTLTKFFFLPARS